MILECDLSQIEWRAAAFLSQDPIMLEEIRSGIDQHAATCVDLMELPLTKENRQDAKIFNFRAIYCNPKSGAYAYYMDARMPSFPQSKWDDIVEGFFLKYKGLHAWHEQIVKEVRKTGQLIGPTGQRWVFQKELKKQGYWDYSVEKIRNYPVQGLSGALIKLAIIIIRKRSEHLKNKKFIMTVHDSLIWDVADQEVEELAKINLEVFQELPDLCKRYFNFYINIPIKGEATYGPTWGEQTKEFKL